MGEVSGEREPSEGGEAAGGEFGDGQALEEGCVVGMAGHACLCIVQYFLGGFVLHSDNALSARLPCGASTVPKNVARREDALSLLFLLASLAALALVQRSAGVSSLVFSFFASPLVWCAEKVGESEASTARGDPMKAADATRSSSSVSLGEAPRGNSNVVHKSCRFHCA